MTTTAPQPRGEDRLARLERVVARQLDLDVAHLDDYDPDVLSEAGHIVASVPAGVRQQVITCLDDVTRAGIVLQHNVSRWKDLCRTVLTLLDDREDDLPRYSPVAEEIGLEDVFRVLMRLVSHITGETECVPTRAEEQETDTVWMLADRLRIKRGLDRIHAADAFE